MKSLLFSASLLVLLLTSSSSFAPSSFGSRQQIRSTSLHVSEKADVPTEWQRDVLKELKSVIDPDLGADIVTLGFVQNLALNDGVVKFDVELTTPACPVKDQFAAECKRLVKALDWVKDVEVTMTAQEPTAAAPTDVFGLSNVGSIIAVSSCKGGVGKSTTAVNLAFSLQQQGASVGILDADVYGPSLPTMVKPDDDIVRFVGRQIAPLQRNGVKLMSFGYVNDGSAVMRGPMVTQLLDQFLSVTNWGSLDYLILDMPPGTGDIQLTLTQRLNITAAVIVTTPTELSFADVVRGIEMFDSVNVPSVAVVENMAYYEVKENSDQSSKPALDQTALKKAMTEKIMESSEILGITDGAIDKLADDLVKVVLNEYKFNKNENEASRKIPIFGKGHKHRLSEQFGIEHSFSIPLMDQIAADGDNGNPYVLQHPDSTQAKMYQQLAGAVVTEIAKIKYGTSTSASARPSVEYSKDDHTLTINGDTSVTPAALRRDCRCAACVEEMTGRQLLAPSSIPESINPLRMYPTGNYALSVDWSDGHRSLYPYKQIKALLEEKAGSKKVETKSNQSKEKAQVQ